jgi:DNA-binding NarL/FixJ family response regulator
MSNHEIAEHLYLSVNSVKTYIRTAYRRIGVRSRSEAVLWVLRHNLAEADPRVSIAGGADEAG